MNRHIIVPLDGSPESHQALPLARGLAEQIGAAVTLVSVIAPPNDMFLVPQDATHSRMTPRDVERLADENARQEDYLAGIASSFPREEVHQSVRMGSPAEEIIELAAVIENSLILMTSHGRSGIGRVLLGSVATRVIQHASVPVIVVPAAVGAYREHGKTTIELVLVPLDGSELAEQVLPAVEELFGTRVRLHLVSIVEPITPTQVYSTEAVVEHERQARRDAENYLQDVATGLRERGFPVEVEARGDAPARGINDAASDRGADLIALSSHGRTGFQRFLLGSVAERVVREAGTPVMVVRAPHPE